MILERLEAGEISECGPSVPKLTPESVERTPRVVAQMGPEPLLDAMAAHPDFDILIAGRAYDPAPFVAFMAWEAMNEKGLPGYTQLSGEVLGGFYHMGKILECGGLCATPKGMGAQGVMNLDGSFDIKPLDPTSRCTPLSVAAHTLYEKTRPDILHGPGGYIDITKSTFTQLEDDRSVRVHGSIFHLDRVEDRPYTVKLEGARVAGFRTLTMGSFRDPILIPQIHSFLDTAKEFARVQHSHIDEHWDVGFHVYGFNERDPEHVPSEVFIVAEAIAESQDIATSLASTIRVHCTHGSYPNQKATSGNFAMGIGGIFELETRACAEFSIYHLMTLAKGEESAQEISLPQKNLDKQRGLFRWKEITLGLGHASGHGSAPITNGNRHQTLTHTEATAAKQSNASMAPTAAINKSPTTLIDIAKIVRSKNSGPYEVTLDVMFDNASVYNAFKKSNILNREVVTSLYKINPEEMIWSGYFDVAMAFKATIPRQRNGKASCSGGYLENDVHGSQQYIPLVGLPLPASLKEELAALL